MKRKAFTALVALLVLLAATAFAQDAQVWEKRYYVDVFRQATE